MANHEEDVDYLAAENFVFVLVNDAECVADGTLANDGESAFEDCVVELVEGDERTYLSIHAVLGCCVGNLED